MDKVNFAICLAFQYIRTDSVRKAVADSSDCLHQVLKEIDVTHDVIDKYIIMSIKNIVFFIFYQKPLTIHFAVLQFSYLFLYALH